MQGPIAHFAHCLATATSVIYCTTLASPAFSPLSPPLLKAECQPRGRLRQRDLDERRRDPPSLAAVPPGHFSLGAVQQERSQSGPTDSLFGNTAYRRCWWANYWGQGAQVRGQIGEGKPPKNKGKTLEAGISDLNILPFIFCVIQTQVPLTGTHINTWYQCSAKTCTFYTCESI